MAFWRRLFKRRIERVKEYQIPIIKCYCIKHEEVSALFTAVSVENDKLFLTVICSKCFEVIREEGRPK